MPRSVTSRTVTTNRFDEFWALCGGRRTRKPNYISGDAKKGSTVGTKSYRVIASRDKGK
jgi:hypothetical protein